MQEGTGRSPGKNLTAMCHLHLTIVSKASVGSFLIDIHSEAMKKPSVCIFAYGALVEIMLEASKLHRQCSVS